MVRQLIMEFIILIGYGLLEQLTIRLFKLPHKRATWLWAVLLMILSFWNLGFYWYCYVLIVWMIAGIALIILQLTAAHQFIYRQYWPAFWRVTLVISIAAFLVSLTGSYLPVV